MKKKLLAMVLCVAMAGMMLTACGSKTEEAAPATEEAAPAADAEEAPAAEEAAAPAEVSFDVEPEFDPNPDYDKYTVFEYTIEAANATFPVTLSATEDNSKMEIHCNFYGDEQLVTAEKDGDTYKVIEDKTGFMETDTPMICQTGIDANNWAPIN